MPHWPHTLSRWTWPGMETPGPWWCAGGRTGPGSPGSAGHGAPGEWCQGHTRKIIRNYVGIRGVWSHSQVLIKRGPSGFLFTLTAPHWWWWEEKIPLASPQIPWRFFTEIPGKLWRNWLQKTINTQTTQLRVALHIYRWVVKESMYIGNAVQFNTWALNKICSDIWWYLALMKIMNFSRGKSTLQVALELGEKNIEINVTMWHWSCFELTEAHL